MIFLGIMILEEYKYFVVDHEGNYVVYNSLRQMANSLRSNG